MDRPHPIALPFLIGAFLLGAGSSPASAPDELELTVEQLSEPSTWVDRIARDGLISFTRRSGERARRNLLAGNVTSDVRALSLMALGSCGGERERSRLESWAHEGSLLERQAAILGLGELGLRDPGPIIRIADEEEPELAECALLALLRSGRPEGVTYVEQVAAVASHVLAPAAAELLLFSRDARSSPRNRTSQLLLDLRWDAARSCGLVRGQAWSTLLLEDLGKSQSFLDEVVYRAAAELDWPGVRDHFLEVIVESQSPEAVRGAVRAMPEQLDSLLEAHLWGPTTVAQWTAILAEIEREKLEASTPNLLRQARYVAHLRLLASILLVRAGHLEGLPLVELDLQSRDELERAAAVEALSSTGVQRYRLDLQRMHEDDDSSTVRAVALVGLVRLGSAAARDEIRGLDAEGDPLEDPLLVEALFRAREDPAVTSLLLELLPDAEGHARLRVATALLLQGRIVPREDIRAALRESAALGASAASASVEYVRALSSSSDLEDLDLLRELFPRENDHELNVELALALIRNQDRSMLPLIRDVAWQGPWNRSVLASAVLVKLAGISILHQELQRPPRGAGTRDFRRMGFALGEWGGLREVEALARRTRSTDPALQGAVLGALSARSQ